MADGAGLGGFKSHAYRVYFGTSLAA